MKIMTTPSSPVRLTKIRYYSKIIIPTISREVYDNEINSTVIKKNIFGQQKWVLKINDVSENKSNLRYYVIVVTCLVVAIAFGLFFTLDKKKSKSDNANVTNFDIVAETIPKNDTKTNEAMTSSFCKCQSTFICLKLTEIDRPKCHPPLDLKDPTGCGGYCTVNTQFCQLLDNKNRIYQCSNVKNVLKCPNGRFNCGNRCVRLEKRCDGIVNCSNGSDEIDCDCDTTTHFRCGNSTSCLPLSKKCDGIVDCWDKSDETGCRNDQRCPDLPKSKFCDGFVDCPDRSDEPQGCQR